MSDYNACDDGNQVSGDGCSSSCTIEKYYRCVGGNTSTADTCTPTKRPRAQVHKYVDKNNKWRVTFDKKITLPSLSVTSNVWELYSINYGVKIDLTKTDSNGWPYADVTINFGKSLINGTIEFEFERAQIVDDWGNQLRQSYIRLYNTNITYHPLYFATPL